MSIQKRIYKKQLKNLICKELSIPDVLLIKDFSITKIENDIAFVNQKYDVLNLNDNFRNLHTNKIRYPKEENKKIFNLLVIFYQQNI